MPTCTPSHHNDNTFPPQFKNFEEWDHWLSTKCRNGAGKNHFFVKDSKIFCGTCIDFKKAATLSPLCKSLKGVKEQAFIIGVDSTSLTTGKLNGKLWVRLQSIIHKCCADVICI